MSKRQITPSCPVSNWRPRLNEYEPTLKAAGDACSSFVAAMELDTQPRWLTFTGINGCGKTLLMTQLYAESVRINPGNPKNNPIWPPTWQSYSRKSVNTYDACRPPCRWFSEASLVRRMKDGEYDLPFDVRGDFCTALDEVGISRDPTNFVADALSSFFENRINKWALFATNLTLPEVASRIDARIASRMIRDLNRVIEIKASDYALRGT